MIFPKNFVRNYEKKILGTSDRPDTRRLVNETIVPSTQRPCVSY